MHDFGGRVRASTKYELREELTRDGIYWANLRLMQTFGIYNSGRGNLKNNNKVKCTFVIVSK